MLKWFLNNQDLEFIVDQKLCSLVDQVAFSPLVYVTQVDSDFMHMGGRDGGEGLKNKPSFYNSLVKKSLLSSLDMNVIRRVECIWLIRSESRRNSVKARKTLKNLFIYQ